MSHKKIFVISNATFNINIIDYTYIRIKYFMLREHRTKMLSKVKDYTFTNFISVNNQI